VFLQLKAGRRLESEQVTAIVNLVASSVPELTADQVTVIDNTGRLLSAPDAQGEFGTRDKQFEYAGRLEEAYKDRIESLLSPLVGPGRVRAQVVAQVDMSSTEEAREQYNPEHQVVRSEQTSEETSRNGAAGAGLGVPGALTNHPPAPGVAQPPGTAQPAAQTVAAAKAAAAQAAPPPAPAVPDNTSKQATRNYEIDRTLAYTRQPAGRLKRLTVAVLIDNLRTTDAKGAVKETALPKEQLERITGLVKDAVGYDQGRGDSVNVVNASFTGATVDEPKDFESVPIWEKPMVRDIVKAIAGLIALVILFLTVLRPLIRNLVAPVKDSVFAPALPGGDSGSLASEQVAMAARAAESAPGLAYEQQLAAARTLVSQDPKRVAQVVKTMVGRDD
jgi:flagellar M-ring protein FliF